MPAILLTEKAKGFKLDLSSGFNVVDFIALNQGSSTLKYSRGYSL